MVKGQLDIQAVDKDQRLLIIFEMAKILATEHDLETIPTELLYCLIETLEEAEAGMLMLYDPSDGQLKMGVAQGYDPSVLSSLCLAPGEAMSGKLFQADQAESYSTPEAIAAAREKMTPANRELFKAGIIGDINSKKDLIHTSQIR